MTANTASGGDALPGKLFQILRDNTVKVLLSIYQQIRKTQQWPHDWKKSVFLTIPKKGSAKDCSNYGQLPSFRMLVTYIQNPSS